MVNRSVFLTKGTDMDCGVDDTPIFAEKTLVEGEMLDLARQEPVEQLEVGFQVIRMRQFSPVTLEEFFSGMAHNLAQPVIDLQPAFIHRGYGHSDQSLIKIIAESTFALPQSLFGLFANRNILHDAQGEGDLAVSVMDRSGRRLCPKRLAVLPKITLFQRETGNLPT